MSYIPTEWKSGDTVTSAKLNKIENGFSTVAPFIIEAIDEDGSLSLTASTTYNDVMTALNQGRIVMLHVLVNQVYHYMYYYSKISSYDDAYFVDFLGKDDIILTSNDINEPLVVYNSSPSGSAPAA